MHLLASELRKLYAAWLTLRFCTLNGVCVCYVLASRGRLRSVRLRPEQRPLRGSICSTRFQRPQKQLASLKHVFAKALRTLPLQAARFELAAQSDAIALPVARRESLAHSKQPPILYTAVC